MTHQERERLEQVCQHNGLRLLEGPLPAGILALYRYGGARGLIYLSEALRHLPDWLVRSAVYHELGHHYTFSPGLTLEQLDAKADRWAAGQLISKAEYHTAAMATGGDPRQMAEILNVSPRLVRAFRAK